LTTRARGLVARRGRSPHVAAFLSFLWPGLGQAYADRPRAAALFALPVLSVAFILVVEAIGGVEHLAALLITPTSALTILILIVLLAAWRIVAIADAMIGFGIRSPWRRGPTAATFTVLALGVVLVHGMFGYVAWAFYDAGSRIFVESSSDEDPTPSPSAGESADPDGEVVATPLATPATGEDRINILLTGVDSAETREHSLTDTMIVVSIDPETRDVALISFPRDIAHFPLPDGRTYTGKINGLMTWAQEHPAEFPDGPLPTLMNELSFLLGAPIHYYAALDLAGFRRMIDIAGGVDVDNPNPINDPRYDWLDGRFGFRLAAGPVHLDGDTALAYVRSRQGVGDNDFTRARRQQQVLIALREKLTQPTMLVQLPAILDVAGDTIRTNFPSARVEEMITLGRRTAGDEVEQYVLGPPYALRIPPEETNGIYMLRLEMDRLAALSIELFGEDSRYATAPVDD
jgi:LCP family protein required for cell wall assembly